KVVVGGDNGTIYSSIDAGATWKRCPATGLPHGSVSALALSTADQDTIYVGINLANLPRVYRGIVGLDTVHWEELSGGLPPLPVIGIVSHGSLPRVYCACVLEVYEWMEGSQAWESISFGLPAVAISDIDVNHSAGILYVATLGMGVFEYPINA